MPQFVDIANLQELSIVDFLARLGHQPEYKSGKEHFYHSMLRETGRDTPSFTVWDKGGKWRDWGGANQTNISGGGIVQLGTALWPRLSFVEVLHKIREVCDLDISLIPEYVAPKKYPAEKEKPDFKYELVKTQPLGSTFVLDQYLKSRGIHEVAEGHLQEVHYRHRDQSGDQRVFYASGWQNEYGGWEFANAKGFKSSIGPKGISIIPGHPNYAALFEGYMDYLSWLKMNLPVVMPTVIVLNSITMLGRATSLVKDMPMVDIYFDHDSPGRKCTQELIDKVPQAIDRSGEYVGYKDYNDKLKAGLSAPCRGDPEPDPENNRSQRTGYRR